MKLKKILFVILTIFIIYLVLINISFGATATVKIDVLRIRDTPSTTGKALGNLVKGDKVEVVSQSGDWYKIKYDNGKKTGYVYKNYVTLNGSISGNTTNNTTNNVSNNTLTNNNTNTAGNNTVDNTANNTVNTPPSNTTNPSDNNPTTSKPATNKVMISGGSSIYILPSFISSAILKVNEDSDIDKARETINNWTRIDCDGITGWVYNKDIINFDKIVLDTGTNTDTNPDGNTKQQKGKVNANSINVRKSASTKAAVLTSLGKNKEVTIISKSGDWYQVKTSNGTVGYVLAKYITII